MVNEISCLSHVLEIYVFPKKTDWEMLKTKGGKLNENKNITTKLIIDYYHRFNRCNMEPVDIQRH